MVEEDVGLFKYTGNNCYGHKHCFLDAMKWYQGDMRVTMATTLVVNPIAPVTQFFQRKNNRPSAR